MSLPATLGPQVVEWMESCLVHGPGDVQSRPYRLTDEHKAFVWRAYELRDGGRRRYRRAVYSRRKGVAKTELAAAIACAELLGPVRADGFDAAGLPVGVEVASPDIPAVATAEDQAELVYGAARVMLTDGPLAEQVDAGLERIHVAGRPGSMYLVTSRSSSREGARPTFTPMDETHLWSTPQLINLHRTLRRNLGKREAADPWSLETTTAFRPGEGSVAEASHDYGARVMAGEVSDPTLLFDHLEASHEWDITTDEGLRSAIAEASGLALDFTNVDAIVDDFRDPQTDEADARRFWLNQVVKATDQWLDPEVWRSRAMSSETLEPDEKISLGFDGSMYDDATALVGCRLSDGLLFPLGVWERPEGRAAATWEVPRLEVDARVHEAFNTYTVVRFYLDPPFWQTELERWHGEWGDVVASFWTNRDRAMAVALERFHTAANTGELTHDGNPTLTRHVANTRRRETRSGVLVRKEHPKSDRKIDAAVAAVLAFEARADALAAGALRPEPSREAIFL